MNDIIQQDNTEAMSANTHTGDEAEDRLAASPTSGHQTWCHDADHNPSENHCCTEASDLTEGLLYLTTREVGTVEMPAIVAEFSDWLPMTEAEDVALEMLRLVDLARGHRDGVTLLIESLRLALHGGRA